MDWGGPRIHVGLSDGFRIPMRSYDDKVENGYPLQSIATFCSELNKNG